MKKTASILLSMCCASAMAATVSDSLFGISNFTGADSVIDINNSGATLTLQDSQKEGYLEITGTTFSHNTLKPEGGNLRTYITLTFVVDLSKLDTPSAATPFFTDNVKWGSALTTDRKFTGVWDNVVWNNGNNKTSDVLGTSDTVVLTFNTGWPGTGTESSGSSCPSQLYINGELAYAAYGLAHGNAVNTIYINEQFVGAISEMYVHNSMITGDDAKALYNSVIPEPTTATLSLLALAGLAARRRRR